MPLPPLPALSAVVGPIYLLAFITQDGMGSDRGGGGWGGGEGGGASSEAMAGYQLMVSRALLALPIALLLGPLFSLLLLYISNMVALFDVSLQRGDLSRAPFAPGRS